MLTPDPYDLGYIYAFALDYKNRAKYVKTSGLAKVEGGFDGNVSRLKSAMLFPAFSGHLARYMERCLTLAQIEIEGKATPDFELAPGTASKVLERSRELMREADATTRTAKKSAEEWDSWVKGRIEIGGAPISLLSTRDKHGIQAFISSFITGGWTAIETMAGDLWEEALNSHPNTLSAMRGRKTKFFKETKADDRNENNQLPEQRLKLEIIERFAFDLRQGMGTALRPDQRLDSLPGIREAYARAFSKDFDTIQTAVMDKAFDRLNILRNVIVHRSAIADTAYIKAMDYVDNLPTASLGSTIELNGKIVTKLLADAFDGAIKLIGAVDDWIVAH